MKLFFGVAALLALRLGAAAPAFASPDAGRLDAAAAEITRKSGLPRADVDKLLSDCDASQLSMNFCAWRDQSAADADLSAAAAQAGAGSPRCEARVTRQVALWRQTRDKVCARNAAREYGGGSAETASRSQCAASMTEDYAARFHGPAGCSAR